MGSAVAVGEGERSCLPRPQQVAGEHSCELHPPVQLSQGRCLQAAVVRERRVRPARTQPIHIVDRRRVSEKDQGCHALPSRSAGQYPVNLASRFSLNAVKPSWLSFDRVTSGMAVSDHNMALS